jgi:radical SAM family uncharacterized protein/radical SAM-linked protein
VSQELRRAYEELLPLVEKPARYTGGEHGALRGEAAPGVLRFALAFPEVYEIAQSHLGYQILYDLLNREPGVRAERVYAPWLDLERLLRDRGLPLVSLESFTPLREFDVVGVSLQYELTYTNVLQLLELGALSRFAAERSDDEPIVVAGGPTSFNPEPLAPFLDAVLLGDGEEAIVEIARAMRELRGRPRADRLERLAQIGGIYVPSRFAPEYGDDGRLRRMRPVDGQAAVVSKRILRDLDSIPPPEIHVTPNVKIVHDRASVEVMRGCVKGCRFCQAGYVYRPLRERDPRNVIAAGERLLERGGYDELSLLSLSTADYSCVNPVLSSVMDRFAAERVAVSLPSTRVEAISPRILEEIRKVRKTGFTLAPEAGTQRLRDVIQKEYTDEELLGAARTLFTMGWKHIKLYFMCGLPGETEEDLVGIAELAARVSRQHPKGRGAVTASVSNFVPKSHTPFQWVSQISLEENLERQAILRAECRRRSVDFKWHDARSSWLEGLFSRGDRRLAPLLVAAYERGCRFDGWSEAFRWETWNEAITASGIDPEEYLRRRNLDETLPWDHLDAGLAKKWLQQELRRALEGRLTPDCSIENCTYCGACDFTSIRNVTYHREGAKGSEHRGGDVDPWARAQVSGDEEWETRAWQKIVARKTAKAERLRARRDGATPPQAASASGAPAPVADDAVEPAPLSPCATAEAEAPRRGSGNAEEWLEGDPSALPARPTGVAPPPAAARYRLRYRKVRLARFIGNLELIGVLGRAARRAGLPLAYSGGHHPLPRMSFGPALPVGVESDSELFDLELTRAMPSDEIERRLGPALPPDLELVSVEPIALRAASIESGIESLRFRVDLAPLGNLGTIDLPGRVAAFAAGSPLAVRRRKDREATVDAHEYIRALRLVSDTALEVEIRFGPTGSLKPSSFVEALLALPADDSRRLRIRKLDAPAPPYA